VNNKSNHHNDEPAVVVKITGPDYSRTFVSMNQAEFNDLVDEYFRNGNSKLKPVGLVSNPTGINRAYNHYMKSAEDLIDGMTDTIESIAAVNGESFDEVKRHFLWFIFRGLKTKQSDKLRQAIESRLRPTKKPINIIQSVKTIPSGCIGNSAELMLVNSEWTLD